MKHFICLLSALVLASCGNLANNLVAGNSSSSSSTIENSESEFSTSAQDSSAATSSSLTSSVEESSSSSVDGSSSALDPNGYLPSYHAIFGNLPEAYSDARSLSGDARLLATAHIEAELRNEGLLAPGLRYLGQQSYTRVFPYSQNGLLSGLCNLATSVAVMTPIKNEDYEHMLAFKGDHESFVGEIAKLGYKAIDSMEIVDPEYSLNSDILGSGSQSFILTMNRGLFDFDESGEPILDLAESVERTEEGAVIEIKEAYWHDAEGNSLRRILASDFVDSYAHWKDEIAENLANPLPFDDYRALDDSHIAITAKNGALPYQFSQRFNYPVASDYRESISEYGKGIENAVYSGDYSAAMNEEGIVLTATKPGITPSIVLKAPKEAEETLTKDEFFSPDCPRAFLNPLGEAEPSPYLVTMPFDQSVEPISFNYGVGDERYLIAMSSPSFRKAVIASLDYPALAEALGKQGFAKADTLSKSNASLSADFAGFSAGATYAEIVGSLLDEPKSASEYLEEAVAELGEGFFDAGPIELPCPSINIRMKDFGVLKEKMEEVLGGFASIEVEEFDAPWLHNFVPYYDLRMPDTGRFLFNAIWKGYQGYISQDPLDFAKPFAEVGSPVLSFIGLE